MAVPISTLTELFRHSAHTLARRDAFREKRGGKWVSISSAEFASDVASLGEGLKALGLETGDRVAILSENRYHWMVADAAVITRAGVVVPIYATLPPAQVAAILRDSDARWIFVSTSEQLAKILDIGEDLWGIRAIVPFDPVTETHALVVPFAELMERGAAALAARHLAPLDTFLPCMSDDLATIIYTSGTTGEPKGVMLSHGNLASNAVASMHAFSITARDYYLSFLPLSHVFERLVTYTMMLAGVSIACGRSLDTVAEDAAEVRPTIMLGVPRFFEKFHERIHAAIESAPPRRRRIFRWAAGVGHRMTERAASGAAPTPGERVQHALARALVYRRLQARVGGRLRFFVSGSAPLRPDIIHFFHAVGLPIYEGYGLTETAPVVAANTPQNLRIGSVGKPYSSIEVRIADDGEILVRGPNVTMGYFRKPDDTRQLFTEDGFLRTGDVGRLDGDGYLYITDRKKDLIITAGGKNVAPQPIEVRLKESAFIADVLLLGDRRRFISALIVPDFAALEGYAREKGLPTDDRAALVRSEAVQTLFEREVERVNEGLARHETVKRFLLVPDELTIENGFLTPTLKLKRRVLEERYREGIERLYA